MTEYKSYKLVPIHSFKKMTECQERQPPQPAAAADATLLSTGDGNLRPPPTKSPGQLVSTKTLDIVHSFKMIHYLYILHI